MSKLPSGNSAIEAVLRRVMDNYWWNRDTSGTTKAPIGLNNEGLTFVNAAGTGEVEALRVDASNRIVLTNGFVLPPGQLAVSQSMVKTFNLATNASLTSQAFWIADGTYTITKITEIHATADGVANTITVQKATGTQSPTQGVTLQSGSFDANGTANTLQTATLAADPTNTLLTLNKGDRLCFIPASAVTSLAGVQITVAMTPGATSLTTEYVMNLNGDIATTTIFDANADYTVTGVQMIWSAAATNAGAVTADVFKDTGTNAPGAGTSCLTAAQSVKGTANTVVAPALTATAATLRLAPGNRLSVKMTGTLTALTGLVVVVSLTPIQNRIEVTWTLKSNANLAVNQCFFTADRTYRVLDMSFVASVAAGGAQKLLVTKDTGTTTPGGGTALQTDNTSAGFDGAATANTVQIATMAILRNSFLLPGDRLGLLWAGAAQSTAGPCITVSLEPR